MYKQTVPAILICIIFFTFISNCSAGEGSSSVPVQTQEFSADIQQKMEHVIDENMASLNIPGVIAGVWIPGQGNWIKARGKADISTGRDIKYTDKVRLASITKTFTITVLLQLVDEGKISLDDTLNKYISFLPDSDEITIRELCNMTSGLYNYNEDPDFDKIYTEEPLHKWTPEEIVNIAISHEPYFAPGKGYYYSNTNTVLIGMIIEKLTCNKLETEVQNRIITPLGLKNTTFATTSDISGEYSHGYVDLNDDGHLSDVTLLDPSCAWSAGAIVSNLDDLYIWAGALAEGELLSEKTQQERLTWSGQTSSPLLKYCLGIYYVGNFLGHNGEIRGYNNCMYYLPSKKATFIVFSNNGTGADKIFQELSKIVLPDDVSW
ncbi:MAG: serine hydrolase domain-containing protein [Candidatus Eremiobacterota bacterium]